VIRAAQKGQQWQRRCQEIYLKKPSRQEISLRNFMPGNLGLTNKIKIKVDSDHIYSTTFLF
jgi:hypothetical protein